MNWFFLILAGFFEVAFTSCLKLADNFTKIPWTIAFCICAIFSFYFLSKATQTIPLGTAYAVWTGIGAAGTVIIGIFLFKEPSSLLRLFFISTLIASIIGLKAVSH